MMRTKLLGLLLLSSSVVACEGPSESAREAGSVGKSASAIQEGTIDSKAAHNFAVGIASRYGAICSGTLIAPNLVLTARHCVVPIDPSASPAVTCDDNFPTKNAAPSSLFVTTSSRLRSSQAKFYTVKAINTPKETGFCGNDIALVTLDENISASEAEPAIPVVQFSMTDEKIGKKIVALGYGNTSPTAEDSGTRRIHEGIGIECVPDDKSYSCKGLYRSDSDREFITEGYVCSGDSGGGAFEQESFSNGKPYVLGALSRGPQTDERCLAAIYSRTDAHADLIIEVGKKAAESGGYEEPAWLSPQSEPAVEGSEDCDGETCTDSDATEPTGEGEGSASTTKSATSGCAAAPGSTPGSSGLVVLAAAALIVARRRKEKN